MIKTLFSIVMFFKNKIEKFF